VYGYQGIATVNANELPQENAVHSKSTGKIAHLQNMSKHVSARAFFNFSNDVNTL